MKYILDDNGEPVLCEDIVAWGAWFETAWRRVALTMIDDIDAEGVNKGYAVSTVFLGLDHNHFAGPPVVWETIVFKGGEGLWFDRCAGSREQAEAMHERMCAKVRDHHKKDLSSRIV